MSDYKLPKITVYKIKINGLDEINFTGYTLVKSGNFDISGKQLPYKLFFLNQHLENADWYTVFSKIEPDVDNQHIPKKMVSGYIFIVQIDGSFYGITGGVGHAQLKKNCEIEHRFGIDIAERILSVPEIKGLVQKNTSGNVTYLDRVFRGSYNPNGDINILKRVLTHVRGKISKENEFYRSVGKSITASDALSVNGSKDINEILTFLIKIDHLYLRQEKNISIPQLEHISKKFHSSLLNILESQLIEHLCTYNSEESTLFLDNEEVGYLPDRVVKYDVIYNRDVKVCDTHEDVFEAVKSILISLDARENRMAYFNKIGLRVHLDDETIDKRDLSYFICGDILYDNDVYFINNHLWYRASKEFISRVDYEINNIEFVPPETLSLLEWDATKYIGRDAEYRYNLAHARYICLDHKLVKIPSERCGIEFCDLLGETGKDLLVMHVKNAHGAALRALFAQGFVSAKFYDEDDGFREKVYAADLKREGCELTDREKTFLSSIKERYKRNIKIIYAIFDNTPSHIVPIDTKTTLDNLRGTLTAFAKVDLLERVNAIRGMAYNVAITRIRPYPVNVG